LAKARNSSISRVHTHPYGSFILCYDEERWEDGRDAIIKSALSTPKYCIMTEDLSAHADNFDIPDRPHSFTSPNGEIVKIDWLNLTYQFKIDPQTKCYMQFFMKCKEVVKTAGMGDTISATGFIYHPPK
jgi:ADP-dependent phosphofructokinase/glucokinase